jgi:hypothetical protein
MTTSIAIVKASKPNTSAKLLCESAGSVGSEQLLALGGTVRQRELEVLGDELLDIWAADGAGVGDFNDLENLLYLLVHFLHGRNSAATYVDGPEAGTVTGSHILVQRLDRSGAGHLSVFLVHIVGAGSRVISDPDTEVLDLERALLVDLVEGNDLAVGLLDLAELHQEIPESGFGDHIIGSEDAHAVEFGGRVRLGRQMAADDLVFLETACRHHC